MNDYADCVCISDGGTNMFKASSGMNVTTKKRLRHLQDCHPVINDFKKIMPRVCQSVLFFLDIQGVKKCLYRY